MHSYRTPSARPHLVRTTLTALAAVAASLLLAMPAEADTTPDALLQRWTVAAGAPASAERGRVFFTSRHGGEWSCASCHNAPPTTEGKHATTSKPIAPMAPAFNAKAFTDEAKVDKWFRRNCKDVVSRECSAAEKADVLAYLVAQKR
jgi:Domain of unknown function (DUF1924)